MGEGEIFKVSCNPRRSVLYKHRRQQGITVSCVWATARAPALQAGVWFLGPAVPLWAASFLMVMLKGSSGGNISIIFSPFEWAGHGQELSICWHCQSLKDVRGCTGIYRAWEEGCSRGLAQLRTKCRKDCCSGEREDKSRRKKQNNKGRKYSSVPKHLLVLLHFLLWLLFWAFSKICACLVCTCRKEVVGMLCVVGLGTCCVDTRLVWWLGNTSTLMTCKICCRQVDSSDLGHLVKAH